MYFRFLVFVALLGRHSECATISVTPKDSIQAAVNEAQPGDTVILGNGEYSQDFRSVRDGTPDKRITITGSRNAVVHGKKESRMIQINHSYITLDGFTASGLAPSSNGSNPEDFVDKCVYILGTSPPKFLREPSGLEYESSLDGVVVSNMHIKECGGECLRLRSFITNAKIVDNKIEGCGRHDYKFESTSKNGEAIYAGTSSTQWQDGKNSRAGPDLSKYILIRGNEIEPQGNECVDVKEGTTDVLVEYNVCSDQRDPDSGCMGSRTDHIIFRHNHISDCEGAGIRVGGHTIDGRVYGVNNEIYGNVFKNTTHSSIKIQTGDDHNLCENKCDDCVLKSKSSALTGIEGMCETTRDIGWIRKEVKELNCKPAKITDSAASSHDGNPPRNAVDGDAATRWSAKGKGAWLSVELQKPVLVEELQMSFYEGNNRQQLFDVYADGKPLLLNTKSSGKTTGLQSFPVPNPTTVTTVTIVCHGNSKDDWNSITEIMVCGDEDSATGPADWSCYESPCKFTLKLSADLEISGREGKYDVVVSGVGVDDSGDTGHCTL